jgi:hypothetical protein
LLSVLESEATGHKWWTRNCEKDFWEAVFVIIFVLFAMSVDRVWHYVVHLSTETYRYGSPSYHPARKEKIFYHRKLYFELFNRVGMEFFTLGALSFIIFVFHQIGLFHVLAEFSFMSKQRLGAKGLLADGNSSVASSSNMASASFAGSSSAGSSGYIPADYFRHPVSAGDWLELAEEVHIRLFISMALYFILILLFVRGSVWRLQLWEGIDEVMTPCDDLSSGGLDNSSHDHGQHSAPVSKFLSSSSPGERLSFLQQVTLPPMLTESRAQDENLHFKSWRTFFISMVLAWEDTNSKVWLELLEVIWPDGPPCLDRARSTTISEGLRDRVRTILEQHFSLAKYFAYSIQNEVMDAIEVSIFCWFGLCGIFGLFCILFRLGLELFHVCLVFFFLSVITIVMMYAKVRRGFAQLEGLCASCLDQQNSDHIRFGNLRLTEASTDVTDLLAFNMQLSQTSSGDVDSVDVRGTTTSHTGRMGKVTARIKDTIDEVSALVNRTVETKPTEMYITRFMEVMLFVYCFTFSCALVDKYGFRHNQASHSVTVLVLYLLGYLLLAVTIPAVMPLFLVGMAMPPYVDACNLADFKQVMKEACQRDLTRFTWEAYERRARMHESTVMRKTMRHQGLSIVELVGRAEHPRAPLSPSWDLTSATSPTRSSIKSPPRICAATTPSQHRSLSQRAPSSRVWASELQRDSSVILREACCGDDDLALLNDDEREFLLHGEAIVEELKSSMVQQALLRRRPSTPASKREESANEAVAESLHEAQL